MGSNNQIFNVYDVKGDISMMMHNLGLNNVNYKVEPNDNKNDFNLSILIGEDRVGEIIGVSGKIRKEYEGNLSESQNWFDKTDLANEFIKLIENKLKGKG